jgi:hypothetical protein
MSHSPAFYHSHTSSYLDASRSIRVGLHSGPVTSGVLRSERSRFQLFGDTVNVTARMEETSVLDRIQISQATASLLTSSGKGHWVKPCNDCDVKVKGKGQMQTYWAHPSNNKSRHGSAKSDADAASVYSESNRHDDEPVEQIDQLLMGKTMHLVDRNVDVMQRILKLMVAQRQAVMPTKHPFGTQRVSN